MEKDDNTTLETKTSQPVFNFNGSVGQINYNSTVNNTYNNGIRIEEKDEADAKEQNNVVLDKAHLREEILTYVGNLWNFYTSEWQLHYKELWNDILDMPVVDLQVYKRGNQHDTHFNRNLVGNIIGYLNRFNIYEENIVPARFTRVLAKEGKGKSVRQALSDKLKPEICEAIKLLMASKKYF